MLYLALILMGSVTVVGYLRSEKEKERRKAREKREGKKMESSLQYGSLKLVPDDQAADELKNRIAVSDAINFKLQEPDNAIVGFKGDLPVGRVESHYTKYALLKKALLENKRIEALVNKVSLDGLSGRQSVAITFEVL